MKPKNQKYSEKSIYEPAFEKYRFHFNHFVSLKVKNIYNVNSMNDSDILSSTVPDNNKRKIRIHFFNFQSYITLILSDKNIFNFQIRKSLLYRRTPAFHRCTPAFHRRTPAFHRRTPAFHRRTPAFHGRTPAFHGRTPAFHRRTPAFHGRTPAFHGRTPAFHRRTPAFHGRTPAFHGRTPAFHRRTPAFQRFKSAFHRRTPAFQRFKSALQRCTAAFQRCKSDIQSNRSANKIIVKDKLRYLSSFKIYAPGKYCYKVILFRITPVEKSIMNIQFVKRNFIPGSKADEFG